MSKRALIADILTSLNMLCGFLAILAAIQGAYGNSIWLIFVAALFDGLDGKVARLGNVESVFGLQLDTLSDVVSFGLAPAVLVHQIQLHKLGVAGVALSFMPVLCSAIRLARFNIIGRTQPQPMYVGMPAPMATLTICGYIMMDRILPEPIGGLRLLAFVVAAMSMLMVSGVRYDKVPKFSLRKGGTNTRNLIIFTGGLVFIPIFPEYVFFPLMMVYLVSGIIRQFASRGTAAGNNAERVS